MATRRDFLKAVTVVGASVGLGGLAVACGDDGGGMGGDGGRCSPNTRIAGNHGHALNVPPADVQSAVDKVYDITGAATHSHTLTINSGYLAMLRAGSTVVLTSSSDADHDHQITISCA